MTEPQSLASMMPGRPKRPAWIIPTVAALAVIALSGVGGTVWLATRPAALPAAAATSAPPTPVTPATTTPVLGFRDDIAAAACLEVDPGKGSDLAAMKALGDKASGSADQHIKLAGMILHDQATLAEMTGKQSDAVRVVAELADLMTACLKGGYKINP